MKKYLSFLIVMLLSAITAYNQAPAIFNYQGVARNSVGNVLQNKTIVLRLSIHDGSATGTIVYQESRTVTTNSFGLFNLQVGGPGAANVTGSIITVNWALGKKYIQVEIDPDGGSSFINIGTAQLASVPYAMNAAGAPPIGPAGGSLTANYPNPIIANAAIIQSMIAPGVTLPPSGPAGGDLTSNYPNPTVARIRGVNVSATVPSINNLLGFDGTNWAPTSLATHPDNYWRKNGNDIYKINTGNVGIGTVTPSANLHIKNNLSASLMLEGSTESRIQFNDPAGTNSGLIYSAADMFISQRGGRIEFNTTFGRLTLTPEGNVGISTPAPHPSSKLEIVSSNSGLLIPRMTESQRNAINNPATSLMIYQTDNTPGYYFYNASAWERLVTPSVLPANLWLANGNNIYNSNAGNVGIGTTTPTSNLHLKGSPFTGINLQSQQSYIQFSNDAGVSEGYIASTNTDLFIDADRDMNISSGRYINFLINNGYKMQILDNGNVGIGTVTPNYKLTVYNNGAGLVHTNGTVTLGTTMNAGAGYFGTFTDHPLYFITGQNQFQPKLTLLPNGNFGVNTINPATKLHVSGNDEIVRLSGNDPYISFYDGGSWGGSLGVAGYDLEMGTPSLNSSGNINFFIKGTNELVIQNDGRVRVGPLACNIPLLGLAPPKLSVFGSLGIKKNFGDQIGEWAISYTDNTPLTVSVNSLKFIYNGGIKAVVSNSDGQWIDLSDQRLKENFQHYQSVLNGIKKLDVLTYHYKADKTNSRTLGLVAQNVQLYFPEIVSETGGQDNFLGIAYGKTGVLAIKAIQEQQVIIEALEKKIETLEKRFAALESKLR